MSLTNWTSGVPKLGKHWTSFWVEFNDPVEFAKVEFSIVEFVNEVRMFVRSSTADCDSGSEPPIETSVSSQRAKCEVRTENSNVIWYKR